MTFISIRGLFHLGFCMAISGKRDVILDTLNIVRYSWNIRCWLGKLIGGGEKSKRCSINQFYLYNLVSESFTNFDSQLNSVIPAILFGWLCLAQPFVWLVNPWLVQIKISQGINICEPGFHPIFMGKIMLRGIEENRIWICYISNGRSVWWFLVKL